MTNFYFRFWSSQQALFHTRSFYISLVMDHDDDRRIQGLDFHQHFGMKKELSYGFLELSPVESLGTHGSIKVLTPRSPTRPTSLAIFFLVYAPSSSFIIINNNLIFFQY